MLVRFLLKLIETIDKYLVLDKSKGVSVGMIIGNGPEQR